jgi:peptidoglycan/LPS O-acetylase OafA/YrhL
MPALVSEALVHHARSTTAPEGRGRIAALDMTKGVLVVLMVVYHSLNYSTDYTLGFKFVPFLPPSFIVITGFLLSHLNSRSGGAADPKSHGRFLLRGLRLLGLFTLLNVVTQLVGGGKFGRESQGVAYFFDHWFEVYVTGDGGYASFLILLPIAYLLLLAPMMISVDRRSRFLMPALAFLLAVVCVVLGRNNEVPVNLALLNAGLVGFCLGRISTRHLLRMKRYWFVAVAAYAGFLGLSRIVWQMAFSQLLDACLALVAIFSVCDAASENSFTSRRLIILGKYSLVSYIFQLAVLQLLARFLGRLAPFSVAFLVQMGLVLLLLVLTAEAVHYARRKIWLVDCSYKALFA